MESKKICEAVENYLRKNSFRRINLKSAMFDMDGVLFDSMKNHAYCWHETMSHFGMYLSREEAYMHEGRTGAGTINIVSMRDRGYEATAEEIEEIYTYKSELFTTCPEPERMPGAWELLQKVKASGVVPMVVTGSGQKTLLERLQSNFPGIFIPQLMVTAFDVKYGKPNPEPYLMGLRKASAFLAEKLNVSCSVPNVEGSMNEESVANENYVINVEGNAEGHTTAELGCGNSIVIENAPLGVQAGVASGCFTIAVNTGPLPDSALLGEGADILFHSMRELCDSWEALFSAFKEVEI